MANIVLPAPGEDPNWGSKLNTAILAVNQDVDQLNNNLEDEVRDIAADVIASDPTIVQAAEESVDDALAAARLMQEAGEVADLNDVPAVSGVMIARQETLNTPGDGSWTVLHQRTSSISGTQLAIGVTSSTRGEMWTRRVSSGTWTPWVQVIRGPELETRLAELVDELRHAPGERESWRVMDGESRVALTVGADGRVLAPDLETRRAAIAGAHVRENPDPGFTIMDAAGKVAFQVDANGRTYIGDPTSAAGGSGTPVNRVVVLWVTGQSNAAGRGLPAGARLDPQHPRVLQSTWSGTTVTGIGPATVPNSAQQIPATAGLGPGDVIAREIVNADDGTVVVICNAARGGSGLVFDTTNGVWQVGYTGSNTHLLPIAKQALTETLTEVDARFPDVPVDVQIMWHQGESDGQTSYQDYADALDALIADFRTHIGDATAPFVAGGLVPERATANDEARSIAAQIDAQARLEHVGFALGVENGGGSSSVTDITHYSRQGVERLGKRMHDALRRAYVNSSASVPLPPLDVTARWRRTSGVLDIEWGMPLCRVTDFTVQYQVDDGSWTTVTGRSPALKPTAQVTGLTTGNEIRVRIATVNENGTSAYTTPVIALGDGPTGI